MRKWFPPAAVVAALALSLAVYSRLPDPLPIHWGLDSRPNGWGSRPIGAFGMPALMIAFAILFRVLPDADPRRDNYEKFWGTYDIIAAATLALILIVHTMALGVALGMAIPMNRIVPALVGAFYICLGNVFPRLRSNWWIGIRTPWSLSSDENWARTQRIGGYLFVAAGILLLADGALPGYWMNRIALSAAVIMPVSAVIFSYAVSLNAE